MTNLCYTLIMESEMKILVSTTEAAKILGVTRQAIIAAVKSGRLKPAESVRSKQYLFAESDIFGYCRRGASISDYCRR